MKIKRFVAQDMRQAHPPGTRDSLGEGGRHPVQQVASMAVSRLTAAVDPESSNPYRRRDSPIARQRIPQDRQKQDTANRLRTLGRRCETVCTAAA